MGYHICEPCGKHQQRACFSQSTQTHECESPSSSGRLIHPIQDPVHSNFFKCRACGGVNETACHNDNGMLQCLSPSADNITVQPFTSGTYVSCQPCGVLGMRACVDNFAGHWCVSPAPH